MLPDFTKIKESVDLALDKYLRKYADKNNYLYKIMRYALFPGGKRVRPVLCVEACVSCGGRRSSVMPAACAIEFIHNFSLIHDDLPSMDDDVYRRGKLTCHKRFGEANAILAGDAMLAAAFQILCEIKDAWALIEAIRTISDAVGLKGIIGGQALDVRFPGAKKNARLSHEINHMKTAALFEASLKCGAICAKADKKTVKKMKRFGILFGLAFQLRDDIMDKAFSKGDLDKKNNELNSLVEEAKRSLDFLNGKADNLLKIADLLTRY